MFLTIPLMRWGERRFWMEFLCSSGLLLPSLAAAGQVPAEYRSQMAQKATQASVRTATINAKVLPEQVLAGKPASIEISIVNGENQPITVAEDWKCRIHIAFPSGAAIDETRLIKKGERTARFDFVPQEVGFASVSLNPETAGSARGNKLELLVLSTNKKAGMKKKAIAKPSTLAPAKWQYANPSSGHLRLAAFSPSGVGLQTPPSSGATSDDGRVLKISLSDTGGSYFADGKDATKITATYESDDLTPAPTDIHVWFHWEHGGAVDPQPLVIPRGSHEGTAHLTSLWPAAVHLNVASTTPKMKVEGDTDVTVSFVPPTMVLLGPDKLSLVDNTPVTVVFLDVHKNPVAPGKNWPVTLHSKESRLHFAPESFEVPEAPLWDRRRCFR
jgi:hypothetical protein